MLIRRAVIVILAVAALWALWDVFHPAMSRTGMGTPEGALIGDQRTLSAAIEAYRKDHNGHPPMLALFELQLGGYTDAAGVPSSKDETHCFGPYIRAMPPVPMGPNKGATAVGPTRVGWVYDESTGSIRGNCEQPRGQLHEVEFDERSVLTESSREGTLPLPLRGRTVDETASTGSASPAKARAALHPWLHSAAPLGPRPMQLSVRAACVRGCGGTGMGPAGGGQDPGLRGGFVASVWG